MRNFLSDHHNLNAVFYSHLCSRTPAANDIIGIDGERILLTTVSGAGVVSACTRGYLGLLRPLMRAVQLGLR